MQDCTFADLEKINSGSYKISSLLSLQENISCTQLLIKIIDILCPIDKNKEEVEKFLKRNLGLK